MRPVARCLGAALLLAQVASVGFATDLLILAGGERRSGTLASCDDERCLFDQAPVLLADLLWIALGIGEGEPPRGIAAPGAVLADGSLTSGKILGLSQGVVVLGSAESATTELERSAVRWLRIAAVLPPVDVLVRRDGALRVGALQGCAAGSCTLAGTTTSRADLAWVGLGASPETIVVPQAPQDPARDQAQFADGSTRVTPLMGVSAGNVVFGIGTFPRAEIAWIYLAPPAAEPGPPVIYRPSPPSGPAEPPQPPQPPRPPQPPQPPQPAPDSQPPQPSGAGTPTGGHVCDPQQGMTPGSGAIWTGTARMHQWMSGPGWLDEDRSDFEVKLREYCEVPVLDLSVTPHRRIGTITWLDSGGTVQHDWHKDEMTGYCLCEGSKTFTEPPWFGGGFYRRTAAGDATAALAFDLPARSFYSVVLSSTGTTLEAPCRGETCGGIGGRTLMQFHAGRFPDVPPEVGWDPEVRDLESGALRGRYTRAVGPATLEVSWSICRAGVPCPPPPEGTGGGTEPPPTEEFDPCGRSGQQAALRDTCHAQLDDLLDGLAPALAEYNTEMKLAEDHRAEFERAQDFCELYDKAKEVLEAIISGGTGPAAEAAQALVYLRDVIEKVQDGDLGSMLYPEQLATYLGYYEKAKAIWFEVTASEIDKMQRDLDGCSGKVPIDTYMAAKKFLEHFQAAKRVWDSKVSPGLNDLRSKGLECAGLDHTAWRACLDDAECQGVPPACGPEPSLEGAYD